MSKFNIFIALSLLFVGMACSSDNSDDPAPVPTPTQGPDTLIQIVDKDTCLLVNNSVTLDANGGECVMIIKTNRAYTLSTSYDWITINEQARGVSEYEHSLNVAANTGERREGDVKVKFHDTKKTTILSFKVIQAAYGAVDKEFSVVGEINDMSTNEWEQKEMYKTKELYLTKVVDIYKGEDEVSVSIADLGSFLMSHSDYGGVVLDDIKSGVLELSYEGGNIDDEYKQNSTNKLDPKDAKKPNGFSYGIAITKTCNLIGASNDVATIAATIGTNDFQELIIKYNRGVGIVGNGFCPSFIVTYTDKMGDKLRVYVNPLCFVYNYPRD